MRLERGFHARRKITPTNVRVHGRLLRPGDPVKIDSGPHAGRRGTFRGKCADGSLIILSGLGSFASLLRVGRKEIAPICHGAPNRAEAE